MGKQKSPGGRTYDKDGYKRRAGCLCYKDETEREVLLVSSSGGPGRWVVPAGCIEAGEEIKTAAVREVLEEACVVGKTKHFIGLFQNDIAKTRTYIYSMIVKEEIDMNLVPLPMYEKRKQRRWFTIEDAITTLIPRPVQQTYITSALQKQSRPKMNQVINNTASISQKNHSQVFCKAPSALLQNKAPSSILQSEGTTCDTCDTNVLLLNSNASSANSNTSLVNSNTLLVNTNNLPINSNISMVNTPLVNTNNRAASNCNRTTSLLEQLLVNLKCNS